LEGKNLLRGAGKILPDILGTDKSPNILGLNNSRGKRIYFYVE
jgi:hypothetical protein